MLDPLRLDRNRCLKNWIKQGKHGKKLVTQEEKRGSVRKFKVACKKCFNDFLAKKAGEADAGLGGTWTKDGYGIMKSLPTTEKPKPLHATMMQIAPGILAKTSEQNLDVHANHLTNLYRFAPSYDDSVLTWTP